MVIAIYVGLMKTLRPIIVPYIMKMPTHIHIFEQRYTKEISIKKD